MSQFSDRAVITALNVLKPVHELRSLTLALNSKRHELTLQLIVLIPNSVYLVTQKDETIGLKVGQVLVRNLDLARRLSPKTGDQLKEVFVRYDTLFDAQRAMARLQPNYEGKEIPALAEWRNDSDKLMQLAWSLTSADKDGHKVYAAEAWEMIESHKGAINPHKVAARKKAELAAQVKDRRGRFNSGRLTLMLHSVDTYVWRRFREVRGIGHRMAFRGMLLETYINLYMEQVTRTRLHFKRLLSVNASFEATTRRTPKQLRKIADDLRRVSGAVETFIARPFCHVFQHIAKDLTQAADLLYQAADQRERLYVESARMFVARSYQSLRLLEYVWELNLLCARVGDVVHKNTPLTKFKAETVVDALYSLKTNLPQVDDRDFERPVVKRIVSHIELAYDALARNLDLTFEGVVEAHTHLKAALAPF